MTSTSITAPGLSGVLRLTWVSDHLAYVLERSQTDEPTGTWTNPQELHQTGEKLQVAC